VVTTQLKTVVVRVTIWVFKNIAQNVSQSMFWSEFTLTFSRGKQPKSILKPFQRFNNLLAQSGHLHYVYIQPWRWIELCLQTLFHCNYADTVTHYWRST
jgi:hypothetical protein